MVLIQQGDNLAILERHAAHAAEAMHQACATFDGRDKAPVIYAANAATLAFQLLGREIEARQNSLVSAYIAAGIDEISEADEICG